jgi:hypothetical protein
MLSSCASASTGRTYGRNDLIKTPQNTLRGGGRPHMSFRHSGPPKKPGLTRLRGVDRNLRTKAAYSQIRPSSETRNQLALGRGRCSLLSSPGRRPAGPCNKVDMGVSLGCCSAEPPRARRYQEATPDCPTSTSPPTLSAEPFRPTGEGTRSWLRFFMCSAMWLRAALILATLRLSL